MGDSRHISPHHRHADAEGYTMGTSRPVAATGERCPSCNGRELVDRVDTLGRVLLRCQTCGWRDDGQRRAAPSVTEMRAMAYPPGAPASLISVSLEESGDPRGAGQRSSLTREAERLADSMPADWTPVRDIQRDLSIDGTKLSNVLTRLLSLGLIERELRELRDQAGRRRKTTVYRRRAA